MAGSFDQSRQNQEGRVGNTHEAGIYPAGRRRARALRPSNASPTTLAADTDGRGSRPEPSTCRTPWSSCSRVCRSRPRKDAAVSGRARGAETDRGDWREEDRRMRPSAGPPCRDRFEPHGRRHDSRSSGVAHRTRCRHRDAQFETHATASWLQEPRGRSDRSRSRRRPPTWRKVDSCSWWPSAPSCQRADVAGGWVRPHVPSQWPPRWLRYPGLASRQDQEEAVVVMAKQL